MGSPACVLCSICAQPVRGLYAWCQGCGHGGHLQHMEAWFARSTTCPTGCGHRCQLNYLPQREGGGAAKPNPKAKPTEEREPGPEDSYVCGACTADFVP